MITEMFCNLTYDLRSDLVSLCCNGEYCHGDKPPGNVFYHFLPSLDINYGKVVVWLRLGRDEDDVMNPKAPKIGEWRVRERIEAHVM
jgi:hypothetical protein